jgi:DNA-binding MarR family transcriptional regulator
MDSQRRILASAMPKHDPTDVPSTARVYAALFPAVYLRFHRRDDKQRELSGASRAVLLHLTLSGPLTVGECSKHLGRAQSVVSEIVDQLEQHALLARVRDERDRRRTLVWLTDKGRARLSEEQEVLSLAVLERAVGELTPRERKKLLEGTRALIEAADRVARHAVATSSTKRRNHESTKASV